MLKREILPTYKIFELRTENMTQYKEVVVFYHVSLWRHFLFICRLIRISLFSQPIITFLGLSSVHLWALSSAESQISLRRNNSWWGVSDWLRLNFSLSRWTYLFFDRVTLINWNPQSNLFLWILRRALSIIFWILFLHKISTLFFEMSNLGIWLIGLSDRVRFPFLWCPV